MVQDLIAAFEQIRFPFRTHVELKDYTTWRIGGPADCFIEPETLMEAGVAFRLARDLNVPCIVIGLGSNLLFDDAGFRGLVIRLGNRFSEVDFNSTCVRADAGVPVPLLARKCASRGLSGLEHTVGIPGTLGGLIFMNGGSMGLAIGDVIEWVQVMKIDGSLAKMTREECAFSYRHSIFQVQGGIVLGAQLRLVPDNSAECLARLEQITKERKGKFPLSLPNCGSVFSNTTELVEAGTSAGREIDRLGLKGISCGSMQISEVHANFIVNRGQGTSSDVFALVKRVRRTVRDASGFNLCCEVRYVSPDGKCAPLDTFLSD